MAQFQNVLRQDQQIILVQLDWSLTDVELLEDIKRQLAWGSSPKLEGFSINILRPNHVPGIDIELERIIPQWRTTFTLVLLVEVKNGQTFIHQTSSFSCSELTEEIRKFKAGKRGP